jgi:DNA repair ATPase RecN
LKIAGEKDPNIIKQLKEEEKEQKKETSSSPVTEFIKVKPIQPITDGIKLDSSNDYDEITNKLIKKINSIENYVNDIYNNTKNLPQNVSENTNKIAYHDKLIQNINQKLDELKLITDDHEKKINDMGIKLQDFNIYDILKGNLQGDGDSSAAIALIQNLEKKVDSKFKLNDDRINKHDEELFKLTKDVTNIKNAQDLINRNLDTIKKRLDDMDKKNRRTFL